MTLYVLLQGATGVKPLPPTPVVQPIAPSQQGTMQVISGNPLNPNLPLTPSGSQTYQVVVNGTGSVSASVQIFGSNDKINWSPIGNPITASGTNSGNKGATSNIGYVFFGALITAISGTNANVTVMMNA